MEMVICNRESSGQLKCFAENIAIKVKEKFVVNGRKWCEENDCKC